MRQILHISDVHFGPPHLAPVADAVVRLVAERQPDLVVLSGDLTQRAKPQQFRQARQFVDRLEAPTLVVPGNHDVPLYRFWERFGRPFGAYRRSFSPELEPVFMDDGLLVIGINTAYGRTFKGGRFTPRRLREVEELLLQASAEVCRIVVAHHPMTQPPWFERQAVAACSWEAMELFTRQGVELVLCGHLHQSFIASSEEFYPRGRPPALVLHSGTTTSNRGRAAERHRNTCNWIRIDDRSLDIRHLEWQPELERFAELSRHRFHRHPRRRESRFGLDGEG